MHTRKEPALTAGALAGKRVLIVEDDGVNQLFLRRVLRADGLSVVGAAHRPTEAMSLAEEVHPDIVLMGVRELTVDATQVIGRLASHHRACVIVLTSVSSEAQVLDSFNAGAYALIAKPVDREYLAAAMAEAYERWCRRTAKPSYPLLARLPQ